MEWEYITHKIDVGGVFSTADFDPKSLDQLLNWYGAQRWELVSPLVTADNSGNSRHIGFVFKRPRLPASVPPVQV